MTSDIVFSPELKRLFNELFPRCKGNVDYKMFFPTMPTIPIARVIYSGNTTTVYFTDGSKCIVKCSSEDKYDRQTAIAYALVKRFFGRVDYSTGLVDGNGIGTKLEKIASEGFDQEDEKRKLAAKKAKAKSEHQARQKAESDAAWQRRVAKRAEEIRLEREATALADSLKKTGKKTLNEAFCDNACNTNASPFGGAFNDSTVFYKRPDKPFSKFTQEEKREYWRYHSNKRKGKK